MKNALASLFAFLVTVMTSGAALACSTCYTDPTSPGAKAINGAILTLLAAWLLVMIGIGAFVIRVIRHNRQSST